MSLERQWQIINLKFLSNNNMTVCGILMNIRDPISSFIPIVSRRFRMNSLEGYNFYIKQFTDWMPLPLTSSFYELDIENGTEIVLAPKDVSIKDIYPEDKFDEKPSISLSEHLVFDGKKKWVVLSGDMLYVYKTQQDEENRCLSESYALVEYCIPLDKKTKVSIDLISTKSRRDIHQIKFNTEEEANTWYDALKNYCKDLDESSEDIPQNTYFGAPLQAALTEGRKIPYVVEHCIQYIEAKAMDLEGIFRLSGSQVQIDKYRDEFNSGIMVDLSNEMDAHTVSGLLKLYFREMHEPLLTFSLYDSFIAAQNEKDNAKRVRYVRHLIKSLPEGNRETLKYLIAFLSRVEKHSDVNKMAIHNLATVFAPNLLKPMEGNMLQVVQDTPLVNGIVSTFIQEFDAIFSEEEPSEVAPVMAITIHDYVAQSDKELSIKKDDIIRVHQQGSKGWWYGELNGKFGLFPGSYVQLKPQTQSKKQQFLKEMEGVRNSIAEENRLIEELELTKKQILKDMHESNLKKEVALTEAKLLRQEVMALLETLQIGGNQENTFEKKLSVLTSNFESLGKTNSAMASSKNTLAESLTTLKKTLITEPKYKKLKDKLLPQIDSVTYQGEEESRASVNVTIKKTEVVQQLNELRDLLNTQ